MKVESKNVITVRLELTEKEARWLKAYIQSYFGKASEEDPKSYEIRHSLFDGLTKALDYET